MAPQQLALPFDFHPELGFEQFHPGANAEIVEHLRNCAEGRGDALIFLWGEAGTGRTHLLNACCRQAALRGRTLAYLPLAAVAIYGPGTLEGLDSQDLVCLDDLDYVAGQAAWEEGLFELFNRLRDIGRNLIVTAPLPPAQLPINLPDLQTRLGWGLTLRLRPLDDRAKIEALDRYARSRGMRLPAAVWEYLLAHHQRDLPALRQLLDDLDHASLEARRPLTVSFVRNYLEKNP